MIYGYARVSTKDQNLDRQIAELQGCTDKIFADKESGKDFNRPMYKAMIKKLKQGDLVIIKSIDRLGRNYDMIIEEWQTITRKKKANIKVLDMPLLDTTQTHELTGKFISDLVLQILSYVAETERANIRQRQAEGIRIAKEKGIKFGRPRKEPEDLKEAYQTGFISRATYFRKLKELKYDNKKTNEIAEARIKYALDR